MTVNVVRMNKNAGVNLKRIRTEQGLTQRNLAEMTGINIRSIQNYEQGKNSLYRASYDRLRKISTALNCEIAELVPIVKNIEKGVDKQA